MSLKSRRFIFAYIFAQGASVTYTFQAMTEFERKHWVESLGGTWPAISTLQNSEQIPSKTISTAWLLPS